jgi:hypothetical protein
MDPEPSHVDPSQENEEFDQYQPEEEVAADFEEHIDGIRQEEVAEGPSERLSASIHPNPMMSQRELFVPRDSECYF